MSLVSCRVDELPLPSTQTQVAPPGGTGGFFLLNEGNMGSNSASLDYFDAASGIYHRNIFAQRNPDVARELGDVGNDMKIYGHRLWVVINCSNLVEVMDIATAHHLGTVPAPNGRYVAFHDRFAYISSYAGPVGEDMDNRPGVVLKVDTATLQIVGQCTVGRQPEEMVVAGDMLYVANSGGYTPANFDTTISVIDLETFTETDKIDVAPNLHRMEVDSRGSLWVSSREGGVYAIDNGEVTAAFPIACNDMAVDGNYLYVLTSSGYTTIDTNTRRTVSALPLPWITKLYGIAANPMTHEIVITDAADYLTPGKVCCLSPDGVLQWQVRTGNIPSRIAFSDVRLEPMDGDQIVPPVPSIRVFEYTPAPGQFINDGVELSSPETAAVWAQERLQTGGAVSLGAYGGYIVVGLEVENTPGYDFAIRGNAFGGSSEPGIVWVSTDANANGLPDDTWHEIYGSDPSTPYSITYRSEGERVLWRGSDGEEGEVPRNQAHLQASYYPVWIADGHTWPGSRLTPRTTGGGEEWVHSNFEWGYVDNLGSDYRSGETLLELDNASVEIGHIDFVKVQTAVVVSAGWLGELSTEVAGLRVL